MKKIIIAILLLTYVLISYADTTPKQSAATDIYHFKTEQHRQRFQKLIKELRCLVCQNENLADSSAPLASDLRQQIAKMMVLGADDQTITHYLVERYGDFILYKPPLTKQTYVLWFAPLLMIMLGLLILLISIRKMKINRVSKTDNQQIEQMLRQADAGKDKTQ